MKWNALVGSCVVLFLATCAVDPEPSDDVGTVEQQVEPPLPLACDGVLPWTAVWRVGSVVRGVETCTCNRIVNFDGERAGRVTQTFGRRCDEGSPPPPPPPPLPCRSSRGPTTRVECPT